MSHHSEPSHKHDPDALLDSYLRVMNFRNLCLVFWGLILAKCLLLQWAIIHYSIPVNGLLFVWTPSFIFAALCVAVYLSTHAEDYATLPKRQRILSNLRYGLIAVVVILTIASLGMGTFAPLLLPGVAALLAGISFLAEGVYTKRRLYLALGIVWWIGAIALLATPTPSALGGLALLTLILVVIPSGIDLFRYRSKVRS
jgi:hypothetical protein